MHHWMFIIFPCVLILAAAVNVSAQDSTTESNKCEDTIPVEDCEFMRENGWCEEDIEYLKRKCDYTCGWCSENKGCVNRASYIDCKDLVDHECNSNPEFYSTRCRKSCGFCDGLPDGIWRGWSEWTECSATCNPGFRNRVRECLTKNCQGKTSEVDICMVKPCPPWLPWMKWDSCTITCGKGVKRRRRICSEGDGCPGNAEEVAECIKPPCVVGNGTQFNKWSKCSRSCGGGTRMKVLFCPASSDDSCARVYEDCNTQRCPYKSCRSYRYGLERSACCSDRERNCVRADRRVIGGTISKPKQFAWMARIEVSGGRLPKNVRRLLCGGTLVHPKYVLTAAHCLEDVTADRLQVLLGAISKFDASTLTQRKLVSSFTMHPNYSEPVNDIAMVELASEAAMTSYVSVLSLPEGEVTAVDTQCFVAGWGLTDFQLNSGSHNLLEAKVRHLPFDICATGHKSSTYGKHMDEKSMMCAGIIAGGRDTCRGDSGGPIMCQRCSSCSWYIAGLTSYGAEECGVANIPGVYTRVLHYENWIESFFVEQ